MIWKGELKLREGKENAKIETLKRKGKQNERKLKKRKKSQ